MGNIFTTILVQPLTNGLILFYRYLGQNLGIAIILFSIFLIFLLKPLTKPYLESMKRIKEMGPQVAKLKKKYGISYEGLVILWERQGKSCAICHKPLSLSASGKSSKPHVDHCHVSKVVRGLLCLTCNTGLGMFGDSVNLLDAAKQYLQLRGAPTVKGNTVPASVSADVREFLETIH